MKRKLKLTITKIYRQTIISQTIFRATCPICCCEVEMLTTLEAAHFLQIDETALAGFIAAGNVHAAATIGGFARVCKNSLIQ